MLNFDTQMNPVPCSPKDNPMQIHSHREKNKELLLDELTDLLLLDESDDALVDERLDAVLDTLEELNPMPEVASDEESLAEFHKKSGPVFKLIEALYE